jgi:hypothetical protein
MAKGLGDFSALIFRLTFGVEKSTNGENLITFY